MGLVAGTGALLVIGTGEPDRAERRADAPREQYREAVRRLGYARSFAYRGSVHTAGPNPLRPGASIATDVAVEGGVRLPQSITRDVAVDDHGRVAETVTSGSRVWSRTASSIERLPGATWQGSQGRPLRIGAFEGVVEESWHRTIGVLSDGATHVGFISDLPADEVARLLTSLRPFVAESTRAA